MAREIIYYRVPCKHLSKLFSFVYEGNVKAKKKEDYLTKGVIWDIKSIFICITLTSCS